MRGPSDKPITGAAEPPSITAQYRLTKPITTAAPSRVDPRWRLQTICVMFQFVTFVRLNAYSCRAEPAAIRCYCLHAVCPGQRTQSEPAQHAGWSRLLHEPTLVYSVVESVLCNYVRSTYVQGFGNGLRLQRGPARMVRAYFPYSATLHTANRPAYQSSRERSEWLEVKSMNVLNCTVIITANST